MFISASLPATAADLVAKSGRGESLFPSAAGVTAQRDGQFTLFEHGARPEPRVTGARFVSARPSKAAAAPEAAGSAIWTRAFSSARQRVLHLIRSAERRHGLPVGLLDALVATESAYRPYAVSRAGAVGLAQLMPGTARSMGVTNSFDAVDNLDGGARYLRAMIDQFGSVALALAAYNAGALLPAHEAFRETERLPTTSNECSLDGGRSAASEVIRL
jgi:soluble lytic murein transglycosylase-like protein